MTATPPASTVSYDVPTSLASLMIALGHPSLAPPSMAPPSLPAVVPAAISYGSGDHVVGLLVRRIEDQFLELERMRVQSEVQASEMERLRVQLGVRTGELARAKADWADAV